MGASAVLSLPMIPILALLAFIQGALATTTSFLLPVSQVLLNLKITHSYSISQGFHFVYNEDSGDLALPISSAWFSEEWKNNFLMFIIFVEPGQCDRLNLVWSRGANDTG